MLFLPVASRFLAAWIGLDVNLPQGKSDALVLSLRADQCLDVQPWLFV